MRRIIGSALWLGLVACSGAPPAEETAQTTQLQQAGKGIEAAEMAEHMLALRAAAVLGDQPEVERRMAAMNEQMRLAMRIPDPARPVNREAARAQVLALEGVRSVVWVDQNHLLVRVTAAPLRTQAMIDQICLRLQPLGDTLAVVVNLQAATAHDYSQLQTLSRNCQLQGDERAFLQARREMDVLPEHYRQQQANAMQHQNTIRKPRDEEAVRAYLQNTPQM